MLKFKANCTSVSVNSCLDLVLVGEFTILEDVFRDIDYFPNHYKHLKVHYLHNISI